MSKAELISKIEAYDNPEILASIELYISHLDSIEVPISKEEKIVVEIDIREANDKKLKDYTSVMAEIRVRIGK